MMGILIFYAVGNNLKYASETCQQKFRNCQMARIFNMPQHFKSKIFKILVKIWRMWLKSLKYEKTDATVFMGSILQFGPILKIFFARIFAWMLTGMFLITLLK